MCGSRRTSPEPTSTEVPCQNMSYQSRQNMWDGLRETKSRTKAYRDLHPNPSSGSAHRGEKASALARHFSGFRRWILSRQAAVQLFLATAIAARLVELSFSQDV